MEAMSLRSDKWGLWYWCHEERASAQFSGLSPTMSGKAVLMEAMSAESDIFMFPDMTKDQKRSGF